MANMKEWLIDVLLVLLVIVVGWVSLTAISAVEEAAKVNNKLSLLDEGN